MDYQTVPGLAASMNEARQKTSPKYTCRATQLYPLFHRLFPGELCFLDIKFQQYRRDGELKQRHRIGRVAIVNSKGQVILDVYAAYPREPDVQKCWQPACFGVITKDLLFENGAVPRRARSKGGLRGFLLGGR